jgi:hydroxymethylpyrimidine pyrophosphatase-like HAD family hydrolase
MQITAILSDYDGTLCPTGNIRKLGENFIPADLEYLLWNISEKIPVCIVSSKDFAFLHSRTTFASVISCIFGIETLVISRHEKTIPKPTDPEEYASFDRIPQCRDFRCIKNSYLSVDDNTLQHNSEILSQIAKEIGSGFKEVTIDQKFTATSRKTLAGITIDWRQRDDWKSFKFNTEPKLRKTIIEKQRELQRNKPGIHIQSYTTHPFIDLYAVKCDKEIAFNYISREIPNIQEKQSQQNILYLGDSENDNPAFRKAAVSIGVHSDTRLKPKLNCKYNISFDRLSVFLKGLLKKDLQFSEDLLNSKI